MTDRLRTITPIGSCRVFGPLKRLAKSAGYDVNRSRSYGYCHSSLEAVQQVRFMQGVYRPSHDAWGLMASGQSLHDLENETHKPSDAYIIELSSPKQITLRGHAIQLNYLHKNFGAFFGSKTRSQDYWEAVDQNLAVQWLDKNWGGLARKVERQILADIRRSFSTAEALHSHLDELTHRLPRVTIVTHVSPTLENGAEIASRSAFIKLVKEVCLDRSIPVYDPTQLAALFGQADALEAESNSFAHYTPSFEEYLAQDLLEFVCHPHDFELYRQKRKTKRKDLALIQEARSHERAGEHAKSLELATELVSCAPSKSRCLWLTSLDEKCGKRSSLSAEMLSSIRTYAGIRVAYRLAHLRADRQHLRETGDAKEAAELIAEFNRCHPVWRTVEYSLDLHDRFSKHAVVTNEILQHIPNWLSELAKIKSLGLRVSTLIKLLSISKGNRAVVQAIQATKKQALHAARAAFSKGDLGQLRKLFQLNTESGLGAREIDVLWARQSYLLGDYHGAKKIAETIVDRDNDHLTSWILLMRAAEKSGASDRSLEAADRVQDLASSNRPKYAEEAQRLRLRLLDVA